MLKRLPYRIMVIGLKGGEVFGLIQSHYDKVMEISQKRDILVGIYTWEILVICHELHLGVLPSLTGGKRYYGLNFFIHASLNTLCFCYTILGIL